MRLHISIALTGLIFFNACSYPVNINAWNEDQAVPSPVFTAFDNDNKGQKPVYTNIKVYEKTQSCEVPYCPLMWHVGVSKFQSPTHIVYGGFQGLGSVTIQSAYPLEKHKNYSLVVTKSGFNGSESVQGYLSFEIAEDGKVIKGAMEE